VKRTLAVAGLALLCGCTAAQVATGLADVSKVIAQGQLVCKVGPTLLALVDPSGAPVLAKGQTATYVNAACAVLDGVAVSPPASGTLGTVTVAVPTV